MRWPGRYPLPLLATKVLLVFAGLVLAVGGGLNLMALYRTHHPPVAGGDLVIPAACLACGLGLLFAGMLLGRGR